MSEAIVRSLADYEREKEAVERIYALHTEVCTIVSDAVRSIMPRVYEIGELLQGVKKSLPHGEFSVWMEKHRQSLGFDMRQGQRYMKIASNKTLLIEQGATDIKSALALLAQPENGEKTKKTVKQVSKNVSEVVFTPNEEKKIRCLMNEAKLNRGQAEKSVVALRKPQRKLLPRAKSDNVLLRHTCRVSSSQKAQIASCVGELGATESEVTRLLLDVALSMKRK